MGDGTELIDDDELLYRRILVSSGYYSPDTETISSQAFAPSKEDASGLSVSRAKYKSAKDAAHGRNGKPAHVAVLRASVLRALGIQVVPKPLPDDPGHAEMPDLNVSNRKENLTIEREILLSNSCLGVEGPFVFSDEQTAK